MSEKKNILIVGAGKIGLLVASLLANSQSYQVYLGDKQKPKNIPTIEHNPIEFFQCDVFDREWLIEKVKQLKINGIVSCLPHNLTLKAGIDVINVFLTLLTMMMTRTFFQIIVRQIKYLNNVLE